MRVQPCSPRSEQKNTLGRFLWTENLTVSVRLNHKYCIDCHLVQKERTILCQDRTFSHYPQQTNKHNHQPNTLGSNTRDSKDFPFTKQIVIAIQLLPRTLLTPYKNSLDIYLYHHHLQAETRNKMSSNNSSSYYSRKFAIVLLAAMLQAGTIDAYFPTAVPKTAFRHVSLSSPLVLSSTTSTDFSTFANSLEADLDDENDETMRASASTATSSDKPWQAKLDDLLDPSTNLADRQILLSELLTSNDKIRDDVLDALTNRKVSESNHQRPER